MIPSQGSPSLSFCYPQSSYSFRLDFHARIGRRLRDVTVTVQSIYTYIQTYVRLKKRTNEQTNKWSNGLTECGWTLIETRVKECDQRYLRAFSLSPSLSVMNTIQSTSVGSFYIHHAACFALPCLAFGVFQSAASWTCFYCRRRRFEILLRIVDRTTRPTNSDLVGNDNLYLKNYL